MRPPLTNAQRSQVRALDARLAQITDHVRKAATTGDSSYLAITAALLSSASLTCTLILADYNRTCTPVRVLP